MSNISTMNELDCLRGILAAAQGGSDISTDNLIALLTAISSTLPTSDPHSAGKWWNNGTSICISNG